MSNISVLITNDVKKINYLVNHILTCPLRDENGKISQFFFSLRNKLFPVFSTEFFEFYEGDIERLNLITTVLKPFLRKTNISVAS